MSLSGKVLIWGVLLTMFGMVGRVYGCPEGMCFVKDAPIFQKSYDWIWSGGSKVSGSFSGCVCFEKDMCTLQMSYVSVRCPVDYVWYGRSEDAFRKKHTYIVNVS